MILIYTVEGSEDGLIATFTSARKAVEFAYRYVEVSCPSWAAADLKRQGIYSVENEKERLTAFVKQWEPNPVLAPHTSK